MIVVLAEPAPMIEMPIPGGTVIPVFHVHVPAGMLMISPFAAVWIGPLMTAFTSG